MDNALALLQCEGGRKRPEEKQYNYDMILNMMQVSVERREVSSSHGVRLQAVTSSVDSQAAGAPAYFNQPEEQQISPIG